MKTSKEFLAEQTRQVSAMEVRLVGKLDRLIEKHGDKDINDIFSPQH